MLNKKRVYEYAKIGALDLSLMLSKAYNDAKDDKKKEEYKQELNQALDELEEINSKLRSFKDK